MALKKFNATRMELMRLKKRSSLAVRGHKLLKDKQDELVRQFMQLIDKIRKLREEVTEQFEEYYKFLGLAESTIPLPKFHQALANTEMTLGFDFSTKNIMNVKVPQFNLREEGELFSYGMMETTSDLDIAILKLRETLKTLFELVEIERAMMELALEIESTRRRVNSLEYVLIPEIKSAIGEITFKLSEIERSHLTRLMRVKEKIV